MQQLQTVDADTLLYEPLEKPSFVVDGLIPTGLSLFCGSQKIGKSWLMLKLCLCVSQGIPLWDMQTLEGDVLYLCLEDTFCRIQDRLFRLTDEASGRLHFAVASCKLPDGLIMQLEDYLKAYPQSRLIVIDTLQKIRTASKDNAYANDYGDISLLKDFADRHSLSVVAVKMNARADGSRGRSNETKLKQARKRYDEVTRLFDRLYEDSLSGRISNENFTRLIDKYQTEQEKLLGQIATLEDALQEVKDSQSNAVQWAELMAGYVGITELTAENLNLLVERIEVSDRTETGDGMQQTVKICYRFGGYIGEQTVKTKMVRKPCKKRDCPRKTAVAK